MSNIKRGHIHSKWCQTMHVSQMHDIMAIMCWLVWNKCRFLEHPCLCVSAKNAVASGHPPFPFFEKKLQPTANVTET